MANCAMYIHRTFDACVNAVCTSLMMVNIRYSSNTRANKNDHKVVNRKLLSVVGSFRLFGSHYHCHCASLVTAYGILQPVIRASAYALIKPIYCPLSLHHHPTVSLTYDTEELQIALQDHTSNLLCVAQAVINSTATFFYFIDDS